MKKGIRVGAEEKLNEENVQPETNAPEEEVLTEAASEEKTEKKAPKKKAAKKTERVGNLQNDRQCANHQKYDAKRREEPGGCRAVCGSEDLFG